MKYVQTVTGRIKPEDMQATLVHEHLLWDQRFYAPKLPEEISEKDFLTKKICMSDLGKIRYNMHAHLDNVFQSDVNEAIDEVLEFKLSGGNTLCDCTCYGLGRDPKAIYRIASATGLNILMGTGMYIEKAHPQNMQTMSIHELADLFIKELFEGVGETGIKAGFIGEIGISESFSQREREVLEASCIAQKESNAALLIHQPGYERYVHEILDLIKQYGGNIQKTVICHCDASFNDVKYQESILNRGAYISFDQFGLEFIINISGYKNVWLPRDAERIKAIANLVKRGYGDGIVMSHDLSFKACYKKYGGYGYSHILDNIVPLLFCEGLANEDIRKIIVDNPRAIFAF
jgi:phosphotriesterase-related protein